MEEEDDVPTELKPLNLRTLFNSVIPLCMQWGMSKDQAFYDTLAKAEERNKPELRKKLDFPNRVLHLDNRGQVQTSRTEMFSPRDFESDFFYLQEEVKKISALSGVYSERGKLVNAWKEFENSRQIQNFDQMVMAFMEIMNGTYILGMDISNFGERVIGNMLLVYLTGDPYDAASLRLPQVQSWAKENKNPSFNGILFVIREQGTINLSFSYASINSVLPILELKDKDKSPLHEQVTTPLRVVTYYTQRRLRDVSDMDHSEKVIGMMTKILLTAYAGGNLPSRNHELLIKSERRLRLPFFPIQPLMFVLQNIMVMWRTTKTQSFEPNLLQINFYQEFPDKEMVTNFLKAAFLVGDERYKNYKNQRKSVVGGMFAALYALTHAVPYIATVGKGYKTVDHEFRPEKIVDVDRPEIDPEFEDEHRDSFEERSKKAYDKFKWNFAPLSVQPLDEGFGPQEEKAMFKKAKTVFQQQLNTRPDLSGGDLTKITSLSRTTTLKLDTENNELSPDPQIVEKEMIMTMLTPPTDYRYKRYPSMASGVLALMKWANKEASPNVSNKEAEEAFNCRKNALEIIARGILETVLTTRGELDALLPYVYSNTLENVQNPPKLDAGLFYVAQKVLHISLFNVVKNNCAKEEITPDFFEVSGLNLNMLAEWLCTVHQTAENDNLNTKNLVIVLESMRTFPEKDRKAKIMEKSEAMRQPFERAVIEILLRCSFNIKDIQSGGKLAAAKDVFTSVLSGFGTVVNPDQVYPLDPSISNVEIASKLKLAVILFYYAQKVDTETRFARQIYNRKFSSVEDVKRKLGNDQFLSTYFPVRLTTYKGKERDNTPNTLMCAEATERMLVNLFTFVRQEGVSLTFKYKISNWVKQAYNEMTKEAGVLDEGKVAQAGSAGTLTEDQKANLQAVQEYLEMIKGQLRSQNQNISNFVAIARRAEVRQEAFGRQLQEVNRDFSREKKAILEIFQNMLQPRAPLPALVENAIRSVEAMHRTVEPILRNVDDPEELFGDIDSSMFGDPQRGDGEGIWPAETDIQNATVNFTRVKNVIQYSDVLQEKEETSTGETSVEKVLENLNRLLGQTAGAATGATRNIRGGRPYVGYTPQPGSSSSAIVKDETGRDARLE